MIEGAIAVVVMIWVLTGPGRAPEPPPEPDFAPAEFVTIEREGLRCETIVSRGRTVWFDCEEIQ